MKTEQIRQAVLEQMGIVPWFPRARLPGAATSHPQTRRALREAAAPQRPPAIAGQPQPEATSSAVASVRSASSGSDSASEVGATSALQRLLQDSPAVPDNSRAARPAEVASEVAPEQPAIAVPSAAAPRTVRFAFCWIHLDEHLAVMAELPAEGRQLPNEARRMLLNIVGALNPRYRAATVQEHNFHWPFVVAPDLPADAQAAQQAVDGFIARRMHDAPVSHVLVLAESMPFYLAQGLRQNQATALHVHDRYGFQVLHTHALHDMLQTAALKRTAWQAMQVLVSALQTGMDGR